jgi:hypothetical protein
MRRNGRPKRYFGRPARRGAKRPNFAEDAIGHPGLIIPVADLCRIAESSEIEPHSSHYRALV